MPGTPPVVNRRRGRCSGASVKRRRRACSRGGLPATRLHKMDRSERRPQPPLNPPVKALLWCLGSFVVCVICFYACLPSLVTRSKERARRANCQYYLKQIGLLCEEYSRNHQGQFPDMWEQVATNASEGLRIFLCPSSLGTRGEATNVSVWSSYVVVPGLSTNSPSGSVLVYEPLATHKGEGANVLLVGGGVKWVRSEDYVKLGIKTR